MSAKIVYTPGSRGKDISWGGGGEPDGPGHNVQMHRFGEQANSDPP